MTRRWPGNWAPGPRMATEMTGSKAVSEERLLTLKEAAEILRLHRRTVSEYVRHGELTGRLIGRRWRFRRKDLDAFFDRAPASWEFGEVSDQEE